MLKILACDERLLVHFSNKNRVIDAATLKLIPSHFDGKEFHYKRALKKTIENRLKLVNREVIDV